MPTAPTPVATRPIPRKKGPPIIGNTLTFTKDQANWVLDAFDEYGDVFVSKIIPGDWYFVRDPEITNLINTTHASDFYKPKIAKRIWKIFLGNGLVPNDGESWKRQHKLIRPAFHKLRIDAYGEEMVRYTRRMVERWKEGEKRDIRDDFTSLTLAIVGKTLFDADVEGDSALIGDAMMDISEMLVEHINMPLPVPRWWPSPGNRRKIRAIESLEEVIHRMVAQRRQDGIDKGDLLSHLIFATDEEGGMSKKQLRDEAMTLIFAGHETTAHAMAWTWYLLSRNPDKAAKLRQEVLRVAGTKPLAVEDLPNLPYTEMVVKESLRLLPSVWMYAREPQRDIQLGPYLFPKGASIFISPFAMGRNEKYYDSPLEYRPERWTRAFEKGLPRGAYVPFAAGPRVCLGKQFAMMEMKLVMGTLAQLVEFNTPADFEPDLVAELSLNPGVKGIPAEARFQPGSPSIDPPAHVAAE